MDITEARRDRGMMELRRAGQSTKRGEPALGTSTQREQDISSSVDLVLVAETEAIHG